MNDAFWRNVVDGLREERVGFTLLQFCQIAEEVRPRHLYLVHTGVVQLDVERRSDGKHVRADNLPVGVVFTAWCLAGDGSMCLLAQAARRTLAVKLHRKGYDLVHIATLLGQKSVSTTKRMVSGDPVRLADIVAKAI